MKRMFFFALSVCVLLSLLFVISGHLNCDNQDVASLFSANVEALTRAESGSGQMCSQTGRAGNY